MHKILLIRRQANWRLGAAQLVAYKLVMIKPYLWDLLVATSVVSAASGLGKLVCLLLPDGGLRPGWQQPPWSAQALVGFAALSLLGFGVCLSGFTPVQRPPFVEALAPQPYLCAFIFAAAVLGAMLMSLRRPRGKPPWAQPWRVAVGLALLAALPWCGLPAFRADESMYHLSLPLQHLLHGGFVQTPGHGNSGFVSFAEMLFFWCLACGSQAAARSLQLFIFYCGVDLAAHLLPKPAAAWAAAALFLSLPVVLWQLPCAYVDVIEATYEVCGLLYLVYAFRPAQPGRLRDSADRSDLYIAALLTGCAAACKYLSLAQIPFVILIALLLLRQGKSKTSARTLASAVAVLCLPWAPYLLHNMVIYKNPLFPFAAGLFGQHEGGLKPAQEQVLERFMSQFGPHQGQEPLFGVEALLHLPSQLFFNADFGSARFDGVIGLVPMALLALGLWAGVQRQKSSLPPALVPTLSAYLVFKAAVWLSTSWQARFLIAPLWVLCLMGAHVVMQMRRPRQRVGVACALVLLQMVSLRSVVSHVPGLDARAFGDVAARRALRQSFSPASALCDELAQSQEQVSRLMLVWSQRLSLWCPFAQWSDSYDEAASLLSVLEQDDVAATTAALQRMHVSHLLVDEAALTEIPPMVGSDERRYLTQALLRYSALKQQKLIEIGHGMSHSLLALPKPGRAPL